MLNSLRHLISSRQLRPRRGLLALALLLVVLTVSGCQTLGFYGQAAKGEYQILARQEPVEKLIANPQTQTSLKEKLQLLENLRSFAEKDLKLPVNGHYRKYADLHRRYVVWNVEAAPEFSLESKSWWYPIVGRLDYRGYFSEQGAQSCAERLRIKGEDVYVDGVEAYSTLGWFKDPALNTFLFQPEAGLAEVIFHELGHQRLFARGDTDFNEAFATTVGQEGARRWLRAKGDTNACAAYEAELRRNDQFVHLIMATRERLAVLYGDERTAGGKLKATTRKQNVPSEEMRQQKRAILDHMEKEYAELKAQWGGNTEYDAWFAKPVNNAQLNSVAAYYNLVPGFEHLLEASGGDLEKFYQAAERLAHQPNEERHKALRTSVSVGDRGAPLDPLWTFQMQEAEEDQEDDEDQIQM